jgi:CHAT domain-containing protein/tetratricopeptide (TPR) repeat protein
MMLGRIGLVLLAMQGTPSEPRAVIAVAIRAVERDSAPMLADRWTRALATDSTDRDALLGLATLARLTFDYDRATPLYARLISGADDRIAVYARIGQAEADRIHRSYATAANGFGQAAGEARRWGDPAAEAEALIGLALVRSRTHPVDSALRLLAAAERLVPAGDAAHQALLRCTRAPILVAASRGDAAKVDSERGLSLAERAGAPRLLALCWRALGIYMYVNVDDPVSAGPFDSAEAIQRRSRDLSGLSETLAWSGTDRLSFFEDGLAKADFRQALATARRAGNRYAEGWALRMLGQLSMRTGDFPAAAEEQEAALARVTPLGDRVELLNLRRAQGQLALSVGRLDDAEAALLEARSLAAEFGQVVAEFQARNWLVLVRAARGDWVSAQREFDVMTGFIRRNGLDALLPGLRYTAGLIALRLGELETAEGEFRSYVAPGSTASTFGRYVSRSRLAELYLRRGEVPRALAEITEANRQLDSIRARLGDSDLRTLVFQSGSQFDEPDYGLATVIAGLVRAGEVNAAFRLAEHRRARELTDRMLRARWVVTDSVKPAGAGSALSEEVGVDLLSTPLDESTAIIEFAAGRRGQPTTVFILTRDALRARVVDPLDSLAPVLERFLALLREGADVSRPARLLGAALLDPALDGLPTGVARLVIVPDDRLHRLPFDAFVLADGRRVIEHFAISTAPSVGIAAALAGRARPVGEVRVLALGDARFPREVEGDDGGDADTYRSAFAAEGGLPRLEASAREARSAGRFGARSVVRLREDASEAFLKSAPLDSFRVVHLATHALVSEWTPARSALALAPGDGEDGFLGPADLASLRLRADLVILSACRTAGGMVTGGEGVQGLTAPLLEAGARAVVATLWPVRDRETAAFMEAFYAALSDGRPATDALRAAKLDAIERGVPASGWASFTLVGDPLTVGPLAAPRSAGWTWLAAAAALTLLAYGLARRKRPTAEAA